MPLINGQKMACEPCIRGHRSTKCTHANERLMVPVRKPGRPLSSCPHPASRPCSCGAVTAAIPRKQKCGCGTSSAVDAVPKIEPDDAVATTSPPSDPKPGNSSYRVQKTTSKSHNSRKQSVGSSSLERMDASQINILPAYEEIRASPPGVPAISLPQVAGVPPYGAIGISPAEAPFGVQPMMYPIFPQPVSPMLAHGATKTNGHATNGSVTPGVEKPAGSCCGGNGAVNGIGSESHSPVIAASESVPEVNRNAATKTKSCCTPAVDSPDSQSGPSAAGPSQSSELPVQQNGTMMPAFQIPMAMPNGMYPFFAQPTVFTYPPQYGSYMQPLLPEQWRQMMTALSFGQQLPVQGFDMGGTAAANSTFNPQNLHTTQQTAQGVSHHCSCGDTCNCVGCAAHPYNEATQNYVRSAWNSMMEDPEHGRRRSHHTNSVNGGANGVNGVNGINGVNGHDHGNHEASADSLPAIAEDKTTPQADGTITEPQTPSDVPSGFSEEQTLSASDFFFVSYPFGETCAGETSSCPCGDDCQCIGCAIHNNPEPAQA